MKYGLAAALGCTMLTPVTRSAQTVDTQIPLTGEKVEGAPFEVKRDWGTFKLADRIAAKVKAGEPINYVFSYQASGIPLFSPQYKAGFDMGCKMAQGHLSDELRVDRAGAERPQPAGRRRSRPSSPPARSIASASSR